MVDTSQTSETNLIMIQQKREKITQSQGAFVELFTDGSNDNMRLTAAAVINNIFSHSTSRSINNNYSRSQGHATCGRLLVVSNYFQGKTLLFFIFSFLFTKLA